MQLDVVRHFDVFEQLVLVGDVLLGAVLAEGSHLLVRLILSFLIEVHDHYFLIYAHLCGGNVKRAVDFTVRYGLEPEIEAIREQEVQLVLLADQEYAHSITSSFSASHIFLANVKEFHDVVLVLRCSFAMLGVVRMANHGSLGPKGARLDMPPAQLPRIAGRFLITLENRAPMVLIVHETNAGPLLVYLVYYYLLLLRYEQDACSELSPGARRQAETPLNTLVNTLLALAVWRLVR